MTSPATYLLTLLALVALSCLTFGLSFLPLGAWAVAVAMAIAAGKATLIATFFMHLREHGTSDRAAVVLGVVFALLLIGFVALDVATRTQLTPILF